MYGMACRSRRQAVGTEADGDKAEILRLQATHVPTQKEVASGSRGGKCQIRVRLGLIVATAGSGLWQTAMFGAVWRWGGGICMLFCCMFHE